MTSDEPGISVSAPATRPPVQDSAVAMVSLRIRQRSSSERERARASLPLMSVAPTFIVPGQADGGARDRGDAFLAAGEPEVLAGGRFYRNPRQSEAGDLGDARAHGVAVRADFRALADQGHVEMRDASAARGNPLDRVFQESVRRRTLPLGIAWRKVRTDIAVRQRAEDCIDQRMEADIAVGMREKAAAVRHADAANHQVIAVAEGVNVVAAAGSDIAEHGAKAGLFADKIFRCGQF